MPPEVLRMILQGVDVQTIVGLRSLHSYLRDIVDGLPDYTFLYTHTRNALRMVLATEAGQYFTLSQLLAAVCDLQCVHCGIYGEWLYVLRMERWCDRCIIRKQRLAPLVTVNYAPLHHCISDED